MDQREEQFRQLEVVLPNGEHVVGDTEAWVSAIIAALPPQVRDQVFKHVQEMKVFVTQPSKPKGLSLFAEGLVVGATVHSPDMKKPEGT